MPSSSHMVMADLFQQSAEMPFADVHFCRDPDSQLQAIISIYSTALGPALGGCRLLRYASTQHALSDALNLSRAMAYKAAINQLPFGGGKAVILAPQRIRSRSNLLTAFGEFVESLGGRYITAVDSGTSSSDMDLIAIRTRHVFCTTQQSKGTGDPSPFTARGVLRGIEAAVKHQLKRDILAGLHVVIQGVGHVGYELARLLSKRGVRLTVSDINPDASKRCRDEFSAQVVKPGDEYSVQCDVFSPCALGQTLNDDSIARLNTTIIAGAANNQLASKDCGLQLTSRGILYAPDYVINSGGILQIGYLQNRLLIKQKIDQLYDRLMRIFCLAEQQQKTTSDIADHIAESILNNHRGEQKLSVVR